MGLTLQLCKVLTWPLIISFEFPHPGRKSRARTVTQHAFCGGTACPHLQETSRCTVTEDRNCVVGQWSPWFRCSTTCGEGEMTREKSIIKQKTCNGLCVETLSEKKNCSQYIPTDCKLSAWTPWTECSTIFFFFFFYIPIKFYSKQTKVTRRCHEEHGNT